MKFLAKLLLIFLIFSKSAIANESANWLKTEINFILDSYKNELTKEEIFQRIQGTVNQNFAGAGIAKFVAGKAWESADKETKKKYINLFKKHLALNIASLMQGYSNQTYSLTNTREDKNNVSMIDMEIINNNSKLVVTWRVKKSNKGRQGDFDSSARRPFGDFGVPGRPQDQRSKYISV